MARVLAVSPVPDVSGIGELVRRWGISRQAVRAVVSREGFPPARVLDQGKVWADEDIAAWEAAEHAAGRAIPGEVGYGPRRGTGGRPRRPKSDA